MQQFRNILSGLCMASIICFSCNNTPTKEKTEIDTSTMSTSTYTPVIKEDSVNFIVAGKHYVGFISYDQNITEKRPGILVIPEWWGVNDYARSRAKQLAQIGYVAMAVDMYGNGYQAADPEAAQKAASVYYNNPYLIKPQIDAALATIKSIPQTDTTNLAAIGYCFGGFIVINAAKEGSDLKGVVSFHGGLQGVPPPKGMNTQFLICHGADDDFENGNVISFKKEMDSAKATYQFITYPDAKHAFTNPAATELGKKFKLDIAYNAAADTASWHDMKAFLNQLFH